MSTNDTQQCLVNFFIFDISRNVPEDEEYQIIVFFHPADTPRDNQMKAVGRAAAIMKFSQTFGQNGMCHTVHTRKTKQYFHEPEPGFCMVMTVKAVDQTCDGSSVFECHDKVFQSLLMHSYKMFRLFMGTMRIQPFVENESQEEFEQLKVRASYFFSQHLQFMPMETADLADAFLGIQFLPLDKLSFLKVSSIVHSVEQVLPCIHSTTILYQDQIVWTGLCQEDIQLVYNYLTAGLLPASVNLPADSRFLTGPVDLRQPGSAARLPRVFLNYDKSPADECHLLVYRVSGVTVCLFIPAVVEPDHDLFTNLDNILAPRLTSMATDVAEHTLMRKNPPSAACNDSIRFLYFNQWNMAFKSTLHQSCPNLRRILHCPSSANIDIIQTCADLSQDFSDWGEGEIVARTRADAWIIGKLSNQRELYVAVTRKNAELVDVCDEVRRLKNAVFKDILLLE